MLSERFPGFAAPVEHPTNPQVDGPGFVGSRGAQADGLTTTRAESFLGFGSNEPGRSEWGWTTT